MTTQSHCDFKFPWSYLIAFKDRGTRANWYRSAAEIEIQIHERMRRTKSGEMPLRYFDGPTMTSYQVPSKASEKIYCRNSEDPEECDSHRGFCSTDTFVPISEFEVKISGVGDMAGRGLFAKQDIPSDAYIATDQSINAVHVGPSVWSVINATRDKANDDQMIHAKEELLGLTTYLEGYGFMSKYLVSEMITYSENIVCIKTASLCLVFFTISHLAFSTRSSLKKKKNRVGSLTQAKTHL